MDLPEDFKQRMEQQLGERYGDFLACYGKERAYGLRYNPLKIQKNLLASRLESEQVLLEPVPWAKEGFYYRKDAQPGKLPLHEAGAYYIQEPSAMSAVELLDPLPGDRVLDLCAAPGGKSTQIGGRLQGRGLLVANEPVPGRAKTLSRNVERMGIANAVVLNELPERLFERFPAFFDKVLVDAPCSGEGMFRKDANVCKEWSLEQVLNCAARQRDILHSAAGMLKPGGFLAYSTCTFAPQENEEMAGWFVQEHPQFSLVKSMRILPHLQRGEGHYAALFYKADNLPEKNRDWAQSCDMGNEFMEKHGKGKNGKNENAKSKNGKNDSDKNKNDRNKDNHKSHYQKSKTGKPGFARNADAVLLLREFMQEVLTEESFLHFSEGIERGQLVAFGDQLYMAPGGIGSLDGLRTERAGLQLGTLKKNRFEPAHALAMALSPGQVKQALELPDPARYLCGESVSCGSQQGWMLVTVDGCSLGWGKAKQGVLKNHYPKGLRWECDRTRRTMG